MLECRPNAFCAFRGLAALLLAIAPAAIAESPGIATGGRLLVAQRSEPRTLNPVLALDEPSRALAAMMHASLVRVNGATQAVEPALAENWTVSADGREIRVRLRDGLRFSDGARLTADDVLFTFEVLQDEKVGSPLREALRPGGRPVEVAKMDDRSLRFTLARTYALGERMLDGVAILPKHLLEPAYRQGKLGGAWTLGADQKGIAGAGPFRLKQYVPGERMVLDRNPNFWKRDPAGRSMPYLDEVVVVFTSGDDAQITHFLAGQADIVAGFGAAGYAMLSSARQKSTYDLHDVGAGLDYTFLLFNLNPGKGRSWFRSPAFRQAVSAAVDRESIARLVYRGKATPIWGHVTPARKDWIAADLPRPPRALDQAKALLRRDGFTWDNAGTLLDAAGLPVEFTAIANAANSTYTQTATILQEDMKQLGIRLTVVPLEFRALVDLVMNRKDYDTAVMALRPGDSDPVADMNVLVSSGRTHLWNLAVPSGGESMRSQWEVEIDRLMEQQLSIRDMAARKVVFQRVQHILHEQMPVVCLVSPNVLVAARKGLGNLKPAVLSNPALWNVEELYWSGGPSSGSRPPRQ
jgi:peptide/nickel transport system substrate-binding protein